MVDTAPWRTALTAVSVSLMLVLVAAAACTERKEPKETVESLKGKSPTLQGKQRLRIGVRGNVPFMGFHDEKTDERSGFEVEIAKAIALDLGYQQDRIIWVTTNSVQDRLSALQGDQADLVVASLSITKERDEFVDFAGPYLLVPQAMMVRRADAERFQTIADLRNAGAHVCTGTGSTSEKALNSKSVTTDPVSDNSVCLAGLKSGKYDGYSTDLPILAGLRGSLPEPERTALEILDMEIADSDERIGIAVPNGDAALRGLIAYHLNRWRTDRAESSPWLRAYDRTIGPWLDQIDPKHRAQPRVDEVPELADFDSKAPRA